MIKRELWLRKIRPFYESELIKVLIGMRCAGKSVILSQIQEEIKASGVDEEHILFLNFEDLKFSSIQDEMALYDYVQERLKDKKKYYLFLTRFKTYGILKRL